LRLTPAGTAALAEAQARDGAVVSTPDVRAEAAGPDRQFLVAGVISTPLRDPAARANLGFSDDEDVPIPVMGELNLQYGLGITAAFARLEQLWLRVVGRDDPPAGIGTWLAS
jgi:hypothetical protein